MFLWELRIYHTSNKTMNENISKKGLTIFKKAYWYDHLKYIDEKNKDNVITSTILQNRRDFKHGYNLKRYVGNDEKVKILRKELRQKYGDMIYHFEAYSIKDDMNILLVVSPYSKEENPRLTSDGWLKIEPIFTNNAVTHVKWHNIQSRKKEKRSRDENEDEKDQNEPLTKKRAGNASAS